MRSSDRLQLEVAHTVVFVHDVDKMIAFYTDVLGFEVADRGPLGPNEIVFLSQISNHHHQVAFITGRPEPDKSNSIHHTAYRSAGTLDDLRALLTVLEQHDEVTGIMPLTHGNAWSIYFSDPEHNGVEVFIDTPWHVQQPQAKPLDLTKSNDEIVATTRAAFADEPEFGDLAEFYDRRADHLAERSAT
ncbi:MAG TPA: VOC family protein [Acidimicrobiales bacterium]|nr:VOC family protein [Acidimicrobiales bacterium]